MAVKRDTEKVGENETGNRGIACLRYFYKNCSHCIYDKDTLSQCPEYLPLEFKELKRKYIGDSIRKHYFVAFDVENNTKPGDPENFKLASIYGELKHGLIVDETYKNIDDFQEDLAYYVGRPNTIGIAYNLGYDQSFTREIVDDSGSLITDSRFIQLTFRKGDTKTFNGRNIVCNGGKVWDIQNISGIEYTLEYWIKQLRKLPEYEKYELKKYELTEEQLEIRNRYDSISTWALADFIQNYFVDSWHIPLKMTVGSNALEIFCTHYLTRTIRRPYEQLIDSFERLSYRGGRNEIFKRGLLGVNSYDVHSMYVAIMKNHVFPMPDTVTYIDEPYSLVKGWRYYYDNYLGIYDVQISIPEMYVCPLPLRAKINGMEKIIYPYGNFRGVYTNKELQIAEKYGCIIEKVYRFCYYTEALPLFSKFAEDIWSRRLLHKKTNEAMDTMDKKTGNSCYGKTGQRIYEYTYSGRISDLPDKILKKINSGELTPYYTEYNDEGYVFVNSKEKRDSKHSFPCIASFVTSYARIKWYERAKQVEKYLVYGDTDSVKFLEEAGKFEDEKDLGGFGYEYTEKDVFFAPKNYMKDEDFIQVLEVNDILKEYNMSNLSQVEKDKIIFEANKILSRQKIKIKGVPKRANIEYIDYDLGVITFSYDAPNKYKSSIRRNKEMAKWERVTKDVKMCDDKRIWFNKIFFNQGIESMPYRIISNSLDTPIIKTDK